MARLLLVCLAEAGLGDELSERDKAIAEETKRKAVAAAKDSVAKHEQEVRRVRLNRSPELRAATNALESARKNLAAATRKPLADYLAAVDNPDEVRELLTPEGVPVGMADAKGLSVVFGYTVAYVPQNSENYDYSFMVVSFDQKKHTEGFLEIEGQPARITAESSDTSILEIEPDPEFTLSPFICRFARPGRVTVTVSAGRYRAEQVIEVVQVPVELEASSADVIESMGFPTDKKKVYISWPEDKFVDCFMYSPEPGEPFIGEHWTYAKFPSLVLSIDDGQLKQLGTRKLDNKTRRVVAVSSPNAEEKPKPAIR